MAFINWQSTYELGIKEFDEHHKHLTSLLNKLYDDFTHGANREALGKVLDELVDYTSYHFVAEEYWMLKYNYPGFSWHLKEHNELKDKVDQFKVDYSMGNEEISLDLLMFLMNWFPDKSLVGR